jgi:nicotinate phosphoribosyltransferase
MWLLKDSPALLTDLYELTMAQTYFDKKIAGDSNFEVWIRKLPENWGFFVMAGLKEFQTYLENFRFTDKDINYLTTTKKFTDQFLNFLKSLKLDVKIRAIPEGSVFFPGEPIMEVSGPLLHTQLLESYCLNILGFSIIEASLATRLVIASNGIGLVDFGLRRTQGPIASIRAARGAQIAGFTGTSNVLAAEILGFSPSGTMAHSFIEAHTYEKDAFVNFAQTYGTEAVLLVDTYDSKDGIKIAADVAEEFYNKRNIKIKGIRIDSGDLAALSKFAREHFQERNVSFLKIFVSGDLDEYKIKNLLEKHAEIDGFGIGTNLAVSTHASSLNIVYKLVEFKGKGVFKTSPGKETHPGRKTVTRTNSTCFEKDIVCPYSDTSDDLLKPFTSYEEIDTIKDRLTCQLSCLDDSTKKIIKPSPYPVEFSF